MSREQSKAARRRLHDPRYAEWFTGNGIDIGAGDDGLSKLTHLSLETVSVRDWDMADGDAQFMGGIEDNTFDFAHSSHTLEHMRDPWMALRNWLRILKPGGHLVVTVPDEDMYERGHWPSIYNSDHKWTFTMWKPYSWSPVSINLLDFLKDRRAFVERLTIIRDGFDPDVPSDQTLGAAECAIEFILRKM